MTAIATLALLGCAPRAMALAPSTDPSSMTHSKHPPTAPAGRLHARPHPLDAHAFTPTTPAAAAPRGEIRLRLGDGARDGLLYVPPHLPADRPAPLVLVLHGAGGRGQQGVGLLRALADHAGVIVLAPDARHETWDVIRRGAYGPDVPFIDRALAYVFARYRVDPARVAIAGFSDGASYALTLGIDNGDLFRDVMAFSPGYAAPVAPVGTPRLFVSHGTRDGVLPIDACSRRVVPSLTRAGYQLRYREFDGPHTVPPAVAHEAVCWWLRDAAPPGVCS